jgi:hypothetical protein
MLLHQRQDLWLDCKTIPQLLTELSPQVLLGSMPLVNGTVIASGGGAESGLYGPTHSGPWCDFTAELRLPAAIAMGH